MIGISPLKFLKNICHLQICLNALAQLINNSDRDRNILKKLLVYFMIRSIHCVTDVYECVRCYL